jgi:Spy/CpxP family protein refolding chaperone
MRKLFLVCFLLTGLTVAGNAQAKHTTTDPIEKAKGLQKQLKLTDEQTTKVATIYKESAEKFEKIKVAEHGNTDKMMKSITPLRAATIKKIKSILTAKQAAKYDALVKDTKASGGNGWSDGWSAASGN